MKVKSNTIKNQNLTHEIFIGLVAGIGTNLEKVVNELKIKILPTNYKIKEITISKLLNNENSVANKSLTDEIEEKIEKCNKFRDEIKRSDSTAILAVVGIVKKRNLEEEKIIYIIRQLKNPDEILTLRKIYGKNFILISIYEHKEKRKKYLKIENATRGFKSDEGKIDDLMKRDENEQIKFGQNTIGAFVEADYFIPMNKLKSSVKRFIYILLGYPYHTPTKDELNMALAWNSSLRSADLSRQVGAVIANEDGDIIASGCNDIPKVGGGMFWEGDDPDFRDFKLGKEPNDEQKEKIIKEFIGKILKIEHDSPKVNRTYKKLQHEKLKIFNIIEYHRAVHAEEAAICDAANRGISTRNTILYSTTCPCHLCTKHIIAAGIKKVVYIHPYPKSQTSELFNDLVVLDPSEDPANKVIFKSFMGIAPRRMPKVFSFPPGTRKQKGKPSKWSVDKASSFFLSKRTPLGYYDKEIAYINELTNGDLKVVDKSVREQIRSVHKKFQLWDKEKQNWAKVEIKIEKN